MTVEQIVERAERDALCQQSPWIYEQVENLVKRGCSNRQIRTLFAQARNIYPELLNRIELTADYLRRKQ